MYVDVWVEEISNVRVRMYIMGFSRKGVWGGIKG